MNDKKSCFITFPLIQYPSYKTTDLNFKYANFSFSLNFHTYFGDGFQFMERRKSSNANASHFLTRLQQLEVLLFLCSTNIIIANSQWLSRVTWPLIPNFQWLSHVTWSVIANSQRLSRVTWSVIANSQWLSRVTWSLIANSQWLSHVIWSVIANSQWLSCVTWSVIVKSQWLSHITWSKNVYKMSDP
jgi:hypothetical protein